MLIYLVTTKKVENGLATVNVTNETCYDIEDLTFIDYSKNYNGNFKVNSECVNTLFENGILRYNIKTLEKFSTMLIEYNVI